MAFNHQIFYSDLGMLSYRNAWDFQESRLQHKLGIKAERRNAGSNNSVDEQIKNEVFFVEHPAVFTLGKSGDDHNLLIGDREREDLDIEFYHTNRGGDITFHGPGQLVCYPIIDLEQFYTDIGKYLRNLEEVVIRTMDDFGLKGERSKGETGVWMDVGIQGRARKICAIGVRCSRWVTMHGFALNVNTDLSYFDHIIPCGIVDKRVTSMQQELGRTASMTEVKKRVVRNFSVVFESEMLDTNLQQTV